ncbi:MAG TPA: hypothetical protein VFN51_01305 [Candidatus Saccharimonadales bacterium]|nr:hypothetical protein [Candidatus Saccharimonadales bacterium]
MKKTSKKLKARKGAWFIAIRGSYLPVSPAGWWTYLPFLAYLIFSGIVGYRDTTSTAMAVMFIIPNWIAAAAVMTYIAARKS